MTDEIKERMGLVTSRLEEALETETRSFWRACIGLSLGEKKNSMEYLDYAVCREQLGHKEGVYLCVLFAQAALAARFAREGRDELVCISRELLVQIYLMNQQKDTPDELRDTLYWFYSDYCGLFVQAQLESIEAGCRLAFGGPVLLCSEDDFGTERFFAEHRWDCGLYLGRRFEERYLQAVKRAFEQSSHRVCRSFAELFPAESFNQRGFLLTGPQREQWKHLTGQLYSMAESVD